MSLALAANGKTLWVANADANNLAVINVSHRGESRSLGFIPVGWYPTSGRLTPGADGTSWWPTAKESFRREPARSQPDAEAGQRDPIHRRLAPRDVERHPDAKAGRNAGTDPRGV